MLPGAQGLLVSVGLAVSITGLTIWSLDRRLRLGLAADMARVYPPLTPLLGGSRGVRG